MDFPGLIFATADATGLSIDGIAQLVSTLTSVGFAVWYAWHTTTVTLPQRDKEHRLTVASLVADLKSKDERHEAAITHLVTDFRQSLKDVTDHCEQELSAIADNYRRETDRLADQIKNSAHFRPISLADEGTRNGGGA